MARATAHKRRRAIREIDKLIGQRIRVLRIEADVTQQQLAETLGITFQQVQKYEKGVNRVSAAQIVAIARRLGVRPSVIVTDAHRDGEGLPTR